MSHYSQVQAGHHSGAPIPGVNVNDYPIMSVGVSFEEAPKRTAILDSKGIYLYAPRPYGSSESDKATDRRAREIRRGYVTKCRNMDHRFASSDQATEASDQLVFRGPFSSRGICL